MNKPGMIRNAVMVIVFGAICIVGMEFLAVNIGQPNPLTSDYTVHAVFSDADGIPTAADVRVSGVQVGKVTAIAHDPNQPGMSVVTLQIGNPNAVPVYSNGFAKVRPKTLLGEKYIDLTVGGRASGEAIADGGYLPEARTAKDVANDEIFNSFDAKTREQNKVVLQELDKATQGRSGDIQALLPQLTQIVDNLSPLAKVYEQDNPQVDDTFVQINTVLQTLADEHEQLAGLLANGNVALHAIAQRNDALVATLQEFSNVATEINAAAAPTVSDQRQALKDLAPAMDWAVKFYQAIDRPDPKCNNSNQVCDLTELITGSLLGQLNYPNDQLTVTNKPGNAKYGEDTTDVWRWMFNYPTNRFDFGNYPSSTTDQGAACHDPDNAHTVNCTHAAQNIVLSFHCDETSGELLSVLGNFEPGLPSSAADSIASAVATACSTVPHTNNGQSSTPAPTTSGATEADWLAGGAT
jgi:virulence factor Mce-like protein